jgi:hypothetical protein
MAGDAALSSDPKRQRDHAQEKDFSNPAAGVLRWSAPLHWSAQARQAPRAERRHRNNLIGW